MLGISINGASTLCSRPPLSRDIRSTGDFLFTRSHLFDVFILGDALEQFGRWHARGRLVGTIHISCDHFASSGLIPKSLDFLSE